MNFTQTLEKILNGEDLSAPEARELMHETMSGLLSPVQIAAWLSAIRTKGETAVEIAAFVEGMRDKALHLPTNLSAIVDTCGTGGDRAHLMNISTLAALTLASLGVPVAKHGNRAVSSSSGSADLLEKLGYNLAETPEQSAIRLEKTKFCFMFAPTYHPAMKHAGPVRKELGVRTVFNILGPLANPAKVSIQLLGVFDRNRLATMTEALRNLGVRQALVVHGSGLDEIHPVQPTEYYELSVQEIRSGIIEPAKLPMPMVNLDELRVSDAAEALAKARGVIDGSFPGGIAAVALNATAALYLFEKDRQKTSEQLMPFIEKNLPRIIEHLQRGKVSGWFKSSF